MDYGVRKAIHKAISGHTPAVNPAFIINPTTGAMERYVPKEKPKRSQRQPAQSTFTLAAVWPENFNQ